MREDTSTVTTDHLAREAFLYVRQSTPRQVAENTESTRRQYDLRRRAVALGWPDDRIITIDSDLGQSGAHAADRAGFQRLVAEVSMGHVGIVLGLEVSRLARNSSDWHQLLELCAFTRTLILDDDGLYDPTQFNDRLLLGLKGTMSEAELHVLHSRLRGGIVSKARRAELRVRLPVGLVYDPRGQVVLDPDRQVQETIGLFFTTFFRLGAAMATVRYFREQHVLFPRRVHAGPRQGELVWGTLGMTRAVHLLHNPRFAGAYVFGRRRHRTGPQGRTTIEALPREQWIACIRDAHPGYITWEQFEEIRRRLQETARAYGQDRRHGPPREGPALLQGRVTCGRCGTRMSVRYHRRPEGLRPDYFCYNRGPTASESPCQVISGAGVDQAMGALVLEVFTPSALRVAVAVEHEIHQRVEDADRHRRRHVERAHYEADLARRRYMQVDPANRLVADSLEADWNDHLRALEQAQREYDAAHVNAQRALTDEARRRIDHLAEEFPALWNDARTPIRERKRLLALLVEDVTLLKADRLTAHVRFRGGATRTLDLPLPLNAWQKRATTPDLLRLIDHLLDDHTDGQVVAMLNQRGVESGADKPFTANALQWVRFHYRVKSLRQRLAERGMVTRPELCRMLGVDRDTVRAWRLAGQLRGRTYNDHGDWMYEVPALDTLRLPAVRTGDSASESRPAVTNLA